jgi:hypothetical protein
MEVAGANRRWRLQFRCRGSRRESAVAQLSTLDDIPLVRITRFKIAGLVVIATAVVFAVALGSPRPLKVEAGFIGYTNDTSRGIVSSGRYARFRLTNRSTVSVRRSGYYEPQEQRWPQDNGWVYAFGDAASLSPGQSEVVAVPALVERDAWRVVFRCSSEGWRARFPIFWRVREQPVMSEWIEK